MLHEGESQRSSMTRRLFAPILPLLLGLVLLGVTTGPVLTSYTDAPVVSATEGRQGHDEQIAEECGELTIEDHFVYDFGINLCLRWVFFGSSCVAFFCYSGGAEWYIMGLRCFLSNFFKN